VSLERDGVGWTLMSIELPLGVTVGGHWWRSCGEGAAYAQRGNWLLHLHLQWSRNEHSDVGCWWRVKLERPGRKRKECPF
jgi:hypothetical protein